MRRQLAILMVLLCFNGLWFIPGCTNIREVETGPAESASVEKRDAPAQFISEEEALKMVMALPEVQEYRRDIKNRMVFITEQSPTAKDPEWVIRVGEDTGQQVVTYNFYRVDAVSGEFIDTEF